MKKFWKTGLLGVGLALFAVTNAFAAVGPEIDPASASGGVALVLTGAAFLLERRRRR